MKEIMQKECLDEKVFINELKKLKFVFRLNIEFDKQLVELYYNDLEDLNTDIFIKSMNDMRRQHKEIYPHTNLIALIREYYINYVPESMKEFTR